jgi:hypothetical protein
LRKNRQHVFADYWPSFAIQFLFKTEMFGFSLSNIRSLATTLYYSFNLSLLQFYAIASSKYFSAISYQLLHLLFASSSSIFLHYFIYIILFYISGSAKEQRNEWTNEIKNIHFLFSVTNSCFRLGSNSIFLLLWNQEERSFFLCAPYCVSLEKETKRRKAKVSNWSVLDLLFSIIQYI